MTAVREFCSDFIKIKRTAFLLLHLLLPGTASALFLLYYGAAGYGIIPDSRWLFLLLELAWPLFAGLSTAVLIRLEQDAGGVESSLGLTKSRVGVYLGKWGFLLFFSAVSLFVCFVCYLAGAWILPEKIGVGGGSLPGAFAICLSYSLFLGGLHMWAAMRFGTGISVLLGMAGTILAGIYENPVGDQIWPLVPWAWGIRLLKHHFGFSHSSGRMGIASLAAGTLALLGLSLLWFSRWEGRNSGE